MQTAAQNRLTKYKHWLISNVSLIWHWLTINICVWQTSCLPAVCCRFINLKQDTSYLHVISQCLSSLSVPVRLELRWSEIFFFAQFRNSEERIALDWISREQPYCIMNECVSFSMCLLVETCRKQLDITIIKH